MKKYFKNIIVASLSVFALISCSEDTMDKINSNNNNPLDVDAKFIVTDLGTATAFRTIGGDFSLYSSVYIEHEAGIHSQMYSAEMRNAEPVSTTTYNNTWVSTYENIKNAKVVIKKCSAGGTEAGSDVTLGIGKVFLAYNAAVLTDLFGDVPYFQASIIDENGLPVYRQPVVDKQEDIYKDIFKQLDEAILLLDGVDAGVKGAVGNKDLIYGGNGEKWKRAAYGLKARYTMRLLNKSANQTADLNDILDYVDSAFVSAQSEFKFDLYDGDSNVNPLAAFSYSRGALAASQSFFRKLDERNDPRTFAFLLEAKHDTQRTEIKYDSIAANGNVTEMQYTYDYMATDYSWDAPTQLLSYHELLFIKAEAYARLGDASNAEAALKEAITAAFANQLAAINSAGYKADLSSTVSDDYYTNSVKPLFDANPLQEIMIQKYLAFAGASGESVEAYNDYRRLTAMGENFITLQNPNNTQGKFPLRFTYGNSDVLANPNVSGLVGDGTYVYSEKVWWAGGTR